MKIYLAGGMTGGMPYSWQDHVVLAAHTVLDPRSWQCDDPQVYTRRDLEAIDEADVLLAFMCSANPSGYGLSVELGYAFAKGKRILFVDNIKEDWRSKYFGMHREMSEVFPSVTAAIATL
jgi:nucleoside 2-deoxyribosyltransferase